MASGVLREPGVVAAGILRAGRASGRESILVVVDVRFVSIFLSKLIFLFQAQLENTLQGRERRWIIIFFVIMNKDKKTFSFD